MEIMYIKEMKKELKKEIGDRLRVLRESLGLTQAEMVTHFDCGRANYSRIEKGDVFPNALILYILKTLFNVSVDWLITGEGRMFTQQAEGKKRKMDFAQCAKELNELFDLIKKIPMIKHAVLGFFLEYKFKNDTLIRQLIEEFENQVKLKQQEETG